MAKDLDGVVTSWNRGAERIFGYTAAEAVGRPMTCLFPADRLDEGPVILEQLNQGKSVEHFESARLMKHGRLIDVSITISPIRDCSGRIVGISKIPRDISERKQVETRNRLLNERLHGERTEELRQRSRLIDRAHDGIKIRSGDGEIGSWNQGAERLLQVVAGRRGHGDGWR
jgi:PAS domain S-box-containing protein